MQYMYLVQCQMLSHRVVFFHGARPNRRHPTSVHFRHHCNENSLPSEQLLKFYNLRCKVEEYQNNTTLDNFSPKSIKKLTLIQHACIHNHTPPLFTLPVCLFNAHLF